VKRLMANWALVVHSLPLPPDLRKAGLDANRDIAAEPTGSVAISVTAMLPVVAFTIPLPETTGVIDR
jgi:hypothetical protein